MKRFIDKFYKSINVFIILLGMLSVMFFSGYTTMLLLVYLGVNAVRYRKPIKETLEGMSSKEKVGHAVAIFSVTVVLSIFMVNWLTYMSAAGVSVWLQYMAVFGLTTAAIVGYLRVVGLLSAKQEVAWNDRSSRHEGKRVLKEAKE